MKANEAAYSGPKSIPDPTALTTVSFPSTGDASGGVSNAQLISFPDLSFHEGLLLAEVTTVNGQGGTPTAPGASKTITVFFAMCDNAALSLSAAPSILGGANLLTVAGALPNSSSSGNAGTRIFQSDVSIHRGKYGYVWVAWDALATNALVNITVKIIRL